ncbi:hypothetical protein ABZP36_027894 [Zizania latifolia]
MEGQRQRWRPDVGDGGPLSATGNGDAHAVPLDVLLSSISLYAALATDNSGDCRHYLIGYVPAPNKQQSLIQPSLLSRAAARGTDLVPIDPERPLPDQDPIHLHIHKLYGDDCRTQHDVLFDSGLLGALRFPLLSSMSSSTTVSSYSRSTSSATITHASSVVACLTSPRRSSRPQGHLCRGLHLLLAGLQPPR